MQTPSAILTLADANFIHYAALGVLLLMAIIFGVGNVLASTLLGKWFSPAKSGPVKGMVYESGVNPIGDARQRFNVRFYIVAMTFLVLDVEIVFLYPWAVTFPSLAEGSGLTGLFFARMLFFIVTTVLAIAYAWRKGVFRYD